nr:unnamed protein product [Callosobruchus analis]
MTFANRRERSQAISKWLSGNMRSPERLCERPGANRAPIHQKVTAILQAGLTAAERTEIWEKFKIPENCLPLKQKRKYNDAFQKEQSDNTKTQGEACKLIANVDNALSVHRKYQIIPHLHPDCAKVPKTVKMDEQHFGKDFHEVFKNDQALKKSCLDLKKRNCTKVTAGTSGTQRKFHQPLNYSRPQYKAKFKGRKREETSPVGNINTITASKPLSEQEFLSHSFEKNLSYAVINSYRSALNLIFSPTEQDLKCINTFIKGVGNVNVRPPKPKYDFKWNPDSVLLFLRTWHPLNSLCLEQLTYKLVFLMAISSASRIQTLTKIKLRDISKTGEKIETRIYIREN